MSAKLFGVAAFDSPGIRFSDAIDADAQLQLVAELDSAQGVNPSFHERRVWVYVAISRGTLHQIKDSIERKATLSNRGSNGTLL